MPVGYTKRVRKEYGMEHIIIVDTGEQAHRFADLMVQGELKKDIPVLFTKSTEAEAVKPFANTYLALRVAYFNKLDTFAEVRCLNIRQMESG